MKTMTAIMILAFSLSLAGCATMQSGSGTGTMSSETKDGKMWTKEDYKRMGINETGTPGN